MKSLKTHFKLENLETGQIKDIYEIIPPKRTTSPRSKPRKGFSKEDFLQKSVLEEGAIEKPNPDMGIYSTESPVAKYLFIHYNSLKVGQIYKVKVEDKVTKYKILTIDDDSPMNTGNE